MLKGRFGVLEVGLHAHSAAAHGIVVNGMTVVHCRHFASPAPDLCYPHCVSIVNPGVVLGPICVCYRGTLLGSSLSVISAYTTWRTCAM